MKNHIDGIVTNAQELAQAYALLGVVPAAVNELREAEAESAFCQAAQDPTITRDQVKQAYLAWQALVFDRIW